MTSFIITAAVLTLLSVAALGWALLARRDNLAASWKVAAVSTLGFIVAVPLLYGVWSKWNWSAPEPSADSPAAMVGRLARRLEREPNDLQGWLMLGRSYSVIEQYPLAARAYQRADRLAGGSNADALTGMAEALVLSSQAVWTERREGCSSRRCCCDSRHTRRPVLRCIAAMGRGELPLRGTVRAPAGRQSAAGKVRATRSRSRFSRLILQPLSSPARHRARVDRRERATPARWGRAAGSALAQHGSPGSRSRQGHTVAPL